MTCTKSPIQGLEMVLLLLSFSRHFSSPDFKLSSHASIPMKFCMRLHNHLPSNRFFCFFEFRKISRIITDFQFLDLAIFTLLYSSPRFLGIFNSASFLKFCMRLHNNLPQNHNFCFFEFRKISRIFTDFQFLDLAIFTLLYSYPRFLGNFCLFISKFRED